MTWRPWRTKGQYNKAPKVATKPGECVSVDQMDATVPGLIGQMAGGIPTTKWYRYATIFVDHYSKLGYVYLQQQLTSKETVNAKKAFKTFATTHGVDILHYHADIGRFADKAFHQAISEKGQTISFCGINAHWQNGVAERRIRELQENANTMLLHAQWRWPDAINKNLWPYALRMANDVHNNVLLRDREDSPMELFSGMRITPHLRYFHHFGCPTYVLKYNKDRKLESGKIKQEWEFTLATHHSILALLHWF
jgi:hypothetical protein